MLLSIGIWAMVSELITFFGPETVEGPVEIWNPIIFVVGILFFAIGAAIASDAFTSRRAGF